MKKIIFLIFALLIPVQANAAYTASAVAEWRSSGSSNLNSGVFDSGVAVPGTDYSQQDSSQANGTNLASLNGTTNPCSITSVTYSFATTDEGNSITISAGSNWTVSRYIITDTDGLGGATLDKACGSSATLTGGTWRLGGAYPGGNSTAGISDDAFLELFVPGNKLHIKAGTYNLNAISVGAAGTNALNINVEGYNSTRGDKPTTIADMPILSFGNNASALGTAWTISNVNIATTSASGISASKAWNIKSVNSSTTASRIAISAGFLLQDSEAVSYLGNAVSIGTTNSLVQGNYIHDSNIGLVVTGSGTPRQSIINNIFENNLTYAIQASSGSGHSGFNIVNNTIYGAENKLGIGVRMETTASNTFLLNNILYGLVTGVSHADNQTSGIDDFNDYYNNTNDVSSSAQWQKGSNDVALDPQFTSATQVTGSSASSSTNVLTDGAASFNSGVVDNQTVVNITACTGTGCRLGNYVVTAHTNTTLTLSPGNITSSGSGSAISYQYTLGHNFAIGTNLKALGSPGAFKEGLTTQYLDIGGVQRQEAGGGSSENLLGVIQ